MECGIVGLPNVGKSTLFNALTATACAQSGNYPFCTIEPNVGSVCVPDERLHILQKLAKSQTIVPAHITFVDIAGLVKGASMGEGLGNQFLGRIRSVQAIVHVVRCFDGDIIHVDGKVDPVSDIEIVETELMLADLQSIDNRLEKKKRDATLVPLLQKAKKVLEEGKWARTAAWTPEEKNFFNILDLITLKPVLYVCNVAEGDIHKKTIPYVEAVKSYVQGAPVLSVCSQLEAEIALLPEEERTAFLTEMGLGETGLSQIIKAGYAVLNLMTYFTVGPKEVHAWTVGTHATAFDAAGVIHTDFQKGFIRAEIISYKDYIACGGWTEAKTLGVFRIEGREYGMQDGDIAFFRFHL